MSESAPSGLPAAAPEGRQLAAVVFLDLVGYSALMQESEARAEAAVQTLWGIARPIVARLGGTEVRLFGDGMLMTFGGTLSAVRACIEVMRQLGAHNQSRADKEKIRARAGVHLGDVGHRGTEIYGDGVNIASRLVALAPPGGVVISPHVRDQVANSLEHPIQSIGVKLLKNIKKPIELFCLPGPDCAAADLDAARAGGEAAARRFRFGAATFDERALELSVAGQPVELDRKSVEVLQYLLQHAGEVATKEELREAATLKDDAALTRCIARLREALRDEEQKQIKAQPGYGYRLAVAVSVEAAPSATLTQFDFKPGDHPPLRPLWSLAKMLGQGGQGEAWLAKHAKTGDQRVYKFALDPARLTSLKREITLSRLLHSTGRSERFIRVVDWNLEIPPYFIECEYGGTDLVAWAQAQGGLAQIPLATRLDLAAQIAEALAAAHSVGVLHKDLKPGNVLVEEKKGNPQIKLADFGSGGVLDADKLESVGITRMGFTRTMLAPETSSGTVLYFAPELYGGQPATVQADVYALGVILFQLVIGDFKKPMSAGWEAEVSDELLREDIAEAAHGNPQKRLPDATTFAQRLRTLDERRAKRAAEAQAQEQARLAREDAERAKRHLEQLRSRRRWTLAVAIALALGLAVAVKMYFDAEKAREEAAAAAKTSKAVADFLSKDLFAQVSAKPLRDLTVGELVDSAAENLKQRERDMPEAAAQIHAALGNAYWMMNRFKEADQQAARAMAQLDRLGQTGSEASLSAATQLLAAEMQLGKRIDLPRYESVLAAGRKQLGSHHPAVLGLRREIAVNRFFSGDWRGAADEFEALVQDEKTDRSVAPLTTADAEIRLGRVFVNLGEFDPARQVLEDALVRLGNPSGPAERSAFLGHILLGEALMNLEQFDAAEAQLSKAREISSRWSPSDSSTMVISVQDEVGRLRIGQGRIEEALSILNGVSKTVRVAVPAAAGEFLAHLAAAYEQAGQLDSAESTMRESLKALDSFQGPHHPLTERARIELADIVRRTKGSAEARRILDGVDAAAVAKLGTDNVLSAKLHRVRGLIALAEHRRAEAQADLKEAVRIYETKYGPQHRLARRARAELEQAQRGSHG